jgi:hypothetical protein
MTSKLSGLSQPSRHVGNALRMGTIIRVATFEKPQGVKVMISAFVAKSNDSDDSIYALLTPHSKVESPTRPVRCQLMRDPGQPRIELGALIPAEDILGAEGEKLGFLVLQLDETPLFKDVQSAAKPVATVKNFRNGVWGGGNFKVRRINDPSWHSPVGARKNLRLYLCNRKGRVAGDVEDVTIVDHGEELQFSYCGLVNRGRDRPLAGAHALGAPVVSQSGALSAIIVGACDNNTLVYPIEELSRDRSLEFVTLGEDWPKVKLST